MDITWSEAIEKILQESDSALDYNDIADLIASKGLRENLGLTPARTVSSYITNDINSKGNNSIFVRTSRGCYTLRNKIENININEISNEEERTKKPIITSYGMYWDINRINWTNPDLFGK